ncbi:PCRF domain-containing protein, partial [Shewanella sp. A3A]|nr:PCRF domain-containing protein [Shewanella ferrihydritica]
LSKEEGSLRETVEKYNEYKEVTQTIKDDTEMLREESDPDLVEMTKEELNEAKERQAQLQDELEVLLIPKDPNDDKNIIMEIRGAAGGDEA